MDNYPYWILRKPYIKQLANYDINKMIKTQLKTREKSQACYFL